MPLPMCHNGWHMYNSMPAYIREVHSQMKNKGGGGEEEKMMKRKQITIKLLYKGNEVHKDKTFHHLERMNQCEHLMNIKLKAIINSLF